MKFSEHLKKNRDFQQVYLRGASEANRTLVLYKLENTLGKNRVGISVSKKVGNSVIRHRLTRLIREGYGGRILLSQDAIGYKKGSPTVRSGANADLIPNHHWGNIFSVFTPLLLEEGVSMAEIDRMLIDNPARFYGA